MRHQGEMPIEGPSAGHGLDKACKAAARVVSRWPNSWGWSLQNFAQVAGEKARVRVAHDHVSRHRRILQPAQAMKDSRSSTERIETTWELGHGVRSTDGPAVPAVHHDLVWEWKSMASPAEGAIRVRIPRDSESFEKSKTPHRRALRAQHTSCEP